MRHAAQLSREKRDWQQKTLTEKKKKIISIKSILKSMQCSIRETLCLSIFIYEKLDYVYRSKRIFLTIMFTRLYILT